MAEEKYLSVSAINNYIAYKIQSDGALKDIYIKGEVSNARISKGHLYFVLKDEESEINAIMFARDVASLTFEVEDGSKVIVKASVSSYPKKGTYNLIVTQMKEYGKGLIYQRFLELKQKLEEAGYFDPAHKLPIPEYPERIGVITSANGDAIKDILSTIKKRYPLVEVRIYNALVQGPDAPKDLIKQIKKANDEKLCDCLIIGRGGGSIEDLDCFNDPDLAIEIYNSKIPIISGVGHENDFTICDFVSDLRAPTPTGAAVLAVKNLNDIIGTMNINLQRIRNIIVTLMNNSHSKVIHLTELLKAHSPENIINKLNDDYLNLMKRLELSSPAKTIDLYNESLEKSIKDLDTFYSKELVNKEHEFSKTIDKLILVNPLNIMKKGYTLVYKDEKLIKSKNELQSNDEVNIKFNDGDVKATIK